MSDLEQRVRELERKLEIMERFFTVRGARIVLKKSVLVEGTLNADRVYTQRSGNHVELTT